MLTCKEMIEYLSRFNPEEGVAVLVADIDKRIVYKISAYQMIDETPAILFETGETEPLDEVLEEVRNE